MDVKGMQRRFWSRVRAKGRETATHIRQGTRWRTKIWSGGTEQADGTLSQPQWEC